MTYGDAPQPPPPPAGPRPHGPPPARRTGRIWLIVGIVAAVLVVLCCGGGTLGLVVLGASGDEVPVPGPTTAASAGPTTVPVDVSSRATDPRPVTVREAFPGRAIVAEGRRYEILRAEEVATCSKAAYGRTVTALEAAGCTQVVRATVVDPSGRYLATVGLANLRDATAAERVYASMDDPDKGTFTPLAVPGTVASTFRRTNGGLVTGIAQGHYAVYCWVGMRSNGEPSSTDKGINRVLEDVCHAGAAPVSKRELGG
jgi:hypothetical protein